MCGRYTLTVPLSNLVDAFDVPPPEFEHSPRFNVAPTQRVPVVAQDREGRRMGLLRWGLVPSWSKDQSIGGRLINARSSFRAAFSRRRCLVPADGFYEWKEEPGPDGAKPTKAPFWIHGNAGEVMAFAGLWERWEPKNEPPLFTFTILTTEASSDIRQIHPRMPVILPPSAYSTWLDLKADASQLQRLLVPWAGPALQAHRVSTLVNSPRNDRPECIECLADQA